MLKYILLGFLNYQPLTGYDLKRIMDESTMHFWHAYHSQIYTTLRKLEEAGLLTSEEIEGDSGETLTRRVYHITAAGQAELAAWLAQPLNTLPPIKEDLLVRLFFSGKRDKAAVLDELRFQRILHQRQLDEYTSLDPEHLAQLIEITPKILPETAYWLTTLEFGKEYEAMYLRWLDKTIAAIEKAV